MARAKRKPRKYRGGFVYILELEKNKYYVGLTRNFEQRMNQHFTGHGSEWTKLHKPKRIIGKIKGSKRIERQVTLAYMKVCGYQNVRGAGYCRRKMRNPPRAVTRATMNHFYGL